MKKECRIWKNEHNEIKKENKETNIIVVECDITIVTDDGCISLATQDSNWEIDYGASFHVTSHSDFFTSYKIDDFSNIRMRNSDISKIVGIGDICLETSFGNNLVLKDVDMDGFIRFLIVVSELGSSSTVWVEAEQNDVINPPSKWCFT